MVSLRHFTSEQFADGTTIDGNRLEKALQDLEDWSNQIKESQFKNRWLQSQFVLKYLPPTTDSDARLVLNTIAGNYRHAPFLPIYNRGTDENPFRVKGTKLHWQSGYTRPTINFNPAAVPPRVPDVIYNDQCVWTSAIALGEEPIIIESIDIVLLTFDAAGTDYSGDWKYDASAAGGGAGDYSNDIHIEITADNPFLPNLQLKNTVIFHKYESIAQASLFSLQAIGLALASDMNPSLTSVTGMVTKPQNSIAMKMEDLNIPIPPYTRLRFSLILPIEAGANPWTATPWKESMPTLSLNILERTVDG